MRQLIIARKDLNMSPGKLAAQVAHASWAFLSNGIRQCMQTAKFDDYEKKYVFKLRLDKDIAEEWFGGIFTKTICEAKNLKQLLKAKLIAEELGLKEGKDFFLIMDACKTELEPEIIDEDGIGRTLTCIGFKPLDDETAWKISKKFQLYR
jgi:PTH2 family peptidyl-tRNA hydrolase